MRCASGRIDLHTIWPTTDNRNVRIIIKPLGLVLVFWMAVAALAYPLMVRWVKRKVPLYRPDVNCLVADNWMFFTKHGGVGSWRLGDRGSLRIAIQKTGRDHSDIGISNPLSVAFGQQDRLRVIVRARCTRPSKVTLVLHRQPGGEDVVWKESVAVGPNWRETRLEFPAQQCPAGDGFFSVFVGSRPGTYEFSNVRLMKRALPATVATAKRG